MGVSQTKGARHEEGSVSRYGWNIGKDNTI